MYDDLVKRLREAPNDWPDADLHYAAADAIEEMIMRLHGDEAAIAGMKREIERMVVSGNKPRWIPVTEALPEDECPVLVTYLGFHDHKPRANMLAYIDRDLGWCWWDDDIPGGVPCSVEITHWRPLPQPPKEET